MPRRSRICALALVACTVLLTLAACGGGTAAPAPAAGSAVPPLGITGADKWFNSEPLTLEGLHGKPVLLVFWADT